MKPEQNELLNVEVPDADVVNYHFSPSTLGFYPEQLLENYKAAGSLPDDIIPVSDECFATYSGNPPAGMQRGCLDGIPAWVDVPKPVVTLDDQKKQARALRDQFISATDKMTLPDYSINDVPLTEEQRAEILSLREEYRRWPSLENWPLIPLPVLDENNHLWILIEAVNNGYTVPVWPNLDS